MNAEKPVEALGIPLTVNLVYLWTQSTSMLHGRVTTMSCFNRPPSSFSVNTRPRWRIRRSSRLLWSGSRPKTSPVSNAMPKTSNNSSNQTASKPSSNTDAINFCKEVQNQLKLNLPRNLRMNFWCGMTSKSSEPKTLPWLTENVPFYNLIGFSSIK